MTDKATSDEHQHKSRANENRCMYCGELMHNFEKSDRNKSPSKKGSWIAAGVFLALLLIFMPFLINKAEQSGADYARNNASQDQKESPESTVSEQPEEDTSDIDLTVSETILGIKVRNNEANDLVNCEVQVNPGTFNSGYTTRASFPSDEEVVVYFDNLTKNTERFDNNKYAVETIVVTRCSGQPSRLGIYGR